MSSDEDVKQRVGQFLQALPHCQVLGMTLEEASSSGVVVHLPFSEELVGNPDTGIIHSGAITTLVDTACGTAVVCQLEGFETCPTLDLRIDHLGLPKPFKPVNAFAEVYRVTQSIAFTRAVAFQEDRDKPFAHAVGTFMRLGRKLSDMTREMGL